MNIAVFGATGGTGRQLLQQALAAGHTVSALARDPTRLELQPGLRVVAGDVLDSAAVADCLASADAVACCLGSRGARAPVEAAGTRRIIEGMQACGVRRLVAVTSLGVGDSREQVGLPFRLVMDFALRAVMQAKAEQEALVRASGLEWTLVRPGGLTDGPLSGAYRHGTGRDLMAGRVSRADVAEFVLSTLCERRYLHQAVAVT